TKRIDELLTEMQKGRVPPAGVVDEYGAALGVVTIEDNVGPNVGEIQDAHDKTPSPVEPLPGGSSPVARPGRRRNPHSPPRRGRLRARRRPRPAPARPLAAGPRGVPGRPPDLHRPRGGPAPHPHRAHPPTPHPVITSPPKRGSSDERLREGAEPPEPASP